MGGNLLIIGTFFARRILGFPLGAYLFVAAIVLLGLASALGLSDLAVFWLTLVLGLVVTFTYGLQQSAR